MLFKDQECSEKLKINAKPGIIAKANEVYRANHPFAKHVDFDELFEQFITLAALQLGLITNKDLGISETEFKELQKNQPGASESVPQPKNNGTLEEGDEASESALDLLN